MHENKTLTNWTIRYYLTEAARRVGSPALTETARGNKHFATCWAMNKIKYSRYKFFDLVEE